MKKQNMPTAIIYSYRPEKQTRVWMKFFGISLCCHLLVFAVIIFFPTRSSVEANIQPPPAISVDLVSFNPELPAPPAAHKTTERAEKTAKPPEQKPLKVLAPEYKPAPRKPLKVKAPPKPTDYVEKEKSAPKVLKSLKSKTYKPSKVIAAAIKKIEKNVAAERPQSIQERIDQLKKKVKDGEKTKEPQKQASLGPAGSSVPGLTGDMDYKNFTQMQIYQTQVAALLRQNWVFSDKLAGDTRGLETRLVIKIMPDGRITDVWFDKRSGNSYLDESAYRTVMKSNPLPPLPQGYAYYHLVLGFTPSGLKQ